MANTTLKFGNGNWAIKEDSALAYSDQYDNFKPLPFDFSRASNATVVNKEGLIESVNSGLPRIDFLGNTQGALLLEPQSTNLNTLSNPTDAQKSSTSYASVTFQDNFNWGLGNLINNAIVFVDNSTTRYAYYNSSVTSGTEYTLSVFIKMDDNSIPIPATDFLMVLAGTSFASGYNVESYGNNVYRASVTGTAGGSNTANGILKIASNSAKGFKISAFQIEEKSYATSYIPTNGATSTRVVETCSQTPPSGVIGQTEGTMYWEGIIYGENSSVNRRIFTISNGTSTTALNMQTPATDSKIEFEVTNGGTTQVFIATANNSLVYGQNFKLAFAYKLNDFVAYMNGNQIGVDTNGTVPLCDNISFDRGNGTSKFEGSASQAKLYNTRLSNSELAALTTI